MILNLALGIVLLAASAARAGDAAVSAPVPAPTPAPLQNPLESKLRMEDAVEANNPFGVVPHRPNYLLPYSYNASPNHAAFLSQSKGQSLQNAEAKFQISFRVPLWKNILARDINFYAAYTQLSYWQVYNSRASTPFRETNYEPEGMVVFLTHYNVFGSGMRHQGLRLRTKPPRFRRNSAYTRFQLRDCSPVPRPFD